MDSKSKLNIIGVFVKKDEILCFLEKLKKDFNFPMKRIFVYTIERNKNEYLVSIKTYEKEKYVKNLEKTSILHVKNGCLFSINALNKLIDTLNQDSCTPNSEYVIDWNDYKDQLMLIVNGELILSKLEKVEDLSILFN
jgi:hypothetical protein